MLKNIRKIVVIAVLAVGIVSLSGCSDDKVQMNLESNVTNATYESGEKTITTVTNNYYVHVTGCVKKPGVYALRVGARLYEAIDKAGGFKKKAQKDYLNLAEAVSDGQKVYVYSKKEYRKLKKTGAKAELQGENAGNGFGGAEPKNENAGGASETAKININTATVEVFKTLSGIGDAKAQAIVDYRNENGNFGSVDELTNVSGIGEATLAKIKDKLTI